MHLKLRLAALVSSLLIGSTGATALDVCPCEVVPPYDTTPSGVCSAPDGVFNISDTIAIGQCLANGDDGCDGLVEICDFNCDGVVDAEDQALWDSGLVASGVCPVPGNDLCANATTVGVGLLAGTTTMATADGAATSGACANAGTGPDSWYRFVAPSDCDLAISTCGGAAWDTLLSVHQGCPGGSGNEIACNDDACGQQSRIVMPVVSGQEYFIRVAGWQGASGPFTMSLFCTAGLPDDCLNALPIALGETATGDTSSATSDGDAPCAESSTSPDVWYRYDALADCPVQVSACGSSYDTVLSVHSGCPGTSTNSLVCNDDACAQTRSRVTFLATTGNSYFIRVAGWQGAVGAYELQIDCASAGGDGPDALAAELNVFNQFGREGAVVGCMMDLTICNAGNAVLDYHVNPNPHHPLYTFNLYRLLDGRFEQIGQSWVKHAWASDTANACGFGCQPPGNNQELGVGCSDTYGVGSNAQQSTLGPRSEINPWSGAFVFEGSHIDLQQGGHGPIDHRLQIHDDDLDPAMNVGAQYFGEFYAVHHQDIDHMNSIAWEPVAISGSPGGTWVFDISASGTVVGPAIEAFTGATITTIASDLVSDGRVLLAMTATDAGGGLWDYQYVLYNHDLDAEIRAFTIPADSSVTITNIGFHAPQSSELIYSNQPWLSQRNAGELFFFAAPPSGGLLPNTLRWGTAYTFTFTADAPPVASQVILHPLNPAPTPQLIGDTLAPSPALPPPPPAIPAISQWGLMALALSMMALGTIMYRRPSALLLR